jgi:hypothetical protein
MAEATRPPAPEDGSGNSPGTGNPYLFAFRGSWLTVPRYRSIGSTQQWARNIQDYRYKCQ